MTTDFDASLCGQKVEIQWESGSWYSCEIVNFSEGSHSVRYADSEFAIVNLRQGRPGRGRRPGGPDAGA